MVKMQYFFCADLGQVRFKTRTCIYQDHKTCKAYYNQTKKFILNVHNLWQHYMKESILHYNK